MKLLVPSVAVIFLMTASAPAQQEQKKAFTFRGKVQQVDAGTKRLTVTNEPIEGWMGVMTMGYGVDREEVLSRVKAGDQITATVYNGDLILHNIQVVPQTSEGGMRLADLEKMALTKNPTVAQADANLSVAMGLAKQAGLYPNPTIGYYGDEIRGGYIAGGKQGGFLSQTIVTGGKLRAARRVAELEANEARTSGELQRLRILNNVRAMFYQVLAAQRMVEVRQNLAKLAGDAAETSRQLGNVGQADRPDILQAEVEQQQAGVSLRIAQRNLESSWRILALVAGSPTLPLTPLDGNLEQVPELNYDEWVATTLKESPEVKLAQQQVDRAEASLVQARKAPIPDLQLTGILTQNNEPLDTTHLATGMMGGAQVGVQLPIFNRNQGNVAAARGGIETAKQELTRVKLELQRNLAGIFRDYDSARLTAEQYKSEMLPRAEQAYRMYQTNYRNMAAAYPQVLISQRTLFQLEAEYIQALENAWQNALAIRGFGLMNGLSAPMMFSGMGSQASGVDNGAYVSSPVQIQ